MNLEVCSSPVTAVCNTAVSVTCISQRLPVNFQSQIQPAHRRLLAANQAKTPASGTVTQSISLGSNDTSNSRLSKSVLYLFFRLLVHVFHYWRQQFIGERTRILDAWITILLVSRENLFYISIITLLSC